MGGCVCALDEVRSVLYGWGWFGIERFLLYGVVCIYAVTLYAHVLFVFQGQVTDFGLSANLCEHVAFVKM